MSTTKRLKYIINIVFMNSEKKLVEVFKAFFDKVVSPVVRTNEKVMNDWRYLSNLISEEHIDFAKLDFYMVMLAPERLSSKHPTPGVFHEKKDSEPLRNNFAKKEFFE